jgi:hypothetical protein
MVIKYFTEQIMPYLYYYYKNSGPMQNLKTIQLFFKFKAKNNWTSIGKEVNINLNFTLYVKMYSQNGS